MNAEDIERSAVYKYKGYPILITSGEDATGSIRGIVNHDGLVHVVAADLQPYYFGDNPVKIFLHRQGNPSIWRICESYSEIKITAYFKDLIETLYHLYASGEAKKKKKENDMAGTQFRVNNVYSLTEYQTRHIVLVTNIDRLATYPISTITGGGTTTVSETRYIVPLIYKGERLTISRLEGPNSVGVYRFRVKADGYKTIEVNSTLDGLSEVIKESSFGTKIGEDDSHNDDWIPADVVAKGQDFAPEAHVLTEAEPVVLEITGSILERYTQITGEFSKATSKINEQFSLVDSKELKEAFMKARGRIEELTSTTPGATSFFTKYAEKIPYAKKFVASIKNTVNETSSAQKNIDYLFGVIQDKYTKLVEVGEAFQEAKAMVLARKEALEELAAESATYLSTFPDAVSQPIRDVATDVQIRGSIEMYKARITKIDGAIMTTQNTIFVFGKDLPALRADLTDETALANLLSTVDDYQKMGQEVAGLVMGVATATDKKAHAVIENLLTAQIENTHVMEYLEQSGNRANAFNVMLEKKTKTLESKIMQDAKIITGIVSKNALTYKPSTAKTVSVGPL